MIEKKQETRSLKDLQKNENIIFDFNNYENSFNNAHGVAREIIEGEIINIWVTFNNSPWDLISRWELVELWKK